MNIFRKLINSEDKKRLLDNYLSLMVLQGVNFLLPLLTLPYLVKTLGVEKFGMVMFAQSFIMFFNLLVDFGFNLSATREISIHRDNPQKLTEIYSSVLSAKLILLFISFLMLVLLLFSIERFSSDCSLYLLSYLMVVGQAMFPVWYFQGQEKMRLVTVVNVVIKVIFTVLIFVVIEKQSDYILVPLIYGIGYILGGVLSLSLVKKIFNQKFVWSGFSPLRYYLVDSSQYFLSRISVTLYTSANVFILGLFAGNTAVGYYSIAEKLYMALQYMYQPIIQTLYPYIAKKKNVALFKKVFWLFISINILIVGTLYLFDSNIFELLFGKMITVASLEVFHILLIATIIVVPTVFLGYPFLAALGYPKYANMSVVYGSLFHITGLLFLVLADKITIFSVAFMVLATESIVFLLRVYWVKKEKLWSIK